MRVTKKKWIFDSSSWTPPSAKVLIVTYQHSFEQWRWEQVCRERTWLNSSNSWQLLNILISSPNSLIASSKLWWNTHLRIWVRSFRLWLSCWLMKTSRLNILPYCFSAWAKILKVKLTLAYVFLRDSCTTPYKFWKEIKKDHKYLLLQSRICSKFLWV